MPASYIIQEYIKYFLKEGRIEEAESTIPSENGKILYQQVFSLSPKLNPKYASFVAREYSGEKHMPPNVVHKDLLEFEKLRPHLEERDINRYKSAYALNVAITNALERQKIKLGKKEQFKEKDLEARKEEQEAIKESKKVYEDKRWLVVQPLTKRASNYYGQTYMSCPTRWCISATESKNYYEEYSSQGISFVFVIDKQGEAKAPMSKVAMAYITPDKIKAKVTYLDDMLEAYSSDDNRLEFEQIYSYYPHELIDKINEFFKINLIPKSEAEEETRIKEVEPQIFANKIETLIELLDEQTYELQKEIHREDEEDNQDIEDHLKDDAQQIYDKIKKLIVLSTPEQLYAAFRPVFEKDDFENYFPNLFYAIKKKLAETIKMPEDVEKFQQFSYNEKHYKNKNGGFVKLLFLIDNFKKIFMKAFENISVEDEEAWSDTFEMQFPGNNIAAQIFESKSFVRLAKALGVTVYATPITAQAVTNIQHYLTSTNTWKQIPFDTNTQTYKDIQAIKNVWYSTVGSSFVKSLPKLIEFIQTGRLIVKNNKTFFK